jgi:hypothetical protein
VAGLASALCAHPCCAQGLHAHTHRFNCSLAQENALDHWLLNGAGNVVLYDTTWGTNAYGMKLGCFTTIGRDGQTIILAVTLLMHENDDSFVWAFEQFLKTFRVAPSVFITDGDPKMARAVAKVFPARTQHMLCIYHLSLNFHEHIKPLFPDKEQFNRAVDLFWRIAKETDERSKTRFEDDWSELTTLASSSTIDNEEKVDAAVEWLGTLASRRQKWAARFTWSTQTLGAHSTQVRSAGPGLAQLAWLCCPAHRNHSTALFVYLRSAPRQCTLL